MAQSLLRRAANLDVCVLMRSSCAFLADSLAASGQLATRREEDQLDALHELN